MLEELNFAYTDVYTGKAQIGEINAQVSLNEVYSKLSTEMKRHIYTLDGTSTISLVDSNQSSITLLNDAEAIGSTGSASQNIAEVEILEERESTSYYLESDGIYYPIFISNFKVELDEENVSTTQPTGSGSLGSGIEISFLDDGENEEKSESNFIIASKSGTTITLTAKSNTNGTTQVVVRDGDVTLTGNIEVTVNPTYTISLGTMTNGSVSITTNNIDTTSNTKYGSGVEITLIATGDAGFTFDNWSDNNIIINPREIIITDDVTYTAIFKERPKPYGAIAQLGTVTVNGNTLKQEWKFFYEDEDTVTNPRIYLIYASYLENVQIPTATDISKNGYNVSGPVYSGNRDCMINYLLGETTTYSAVWNGLATGVETALNTKLTDEQKLEVGTVKAYGAPTVELFQASYDGNYPEDEFRVKYVTDTTTTYQESPGATKKASAEGYVFKNKNRDWYTGVGLGYENKLLYFPVTEKIKETSSQTYNTAGYWLARPFCFPIILFMPG